ncbi:hypothetical protein EDD85DRAFT_770945, partial [Armillaria nabsnona]
VRELLPDRRNFTSILTQLRTAYIGLNSHLYRIKAATSPSCDACGIPETVSQIFLWLYRELCKGF